PEYILGRDSTRIDLDGKLPMDRIGKSERIAEPIHEPIQLVRRQERRCATAKMQLLDTPFGGSQPRLQINFTRQIVEILFRLAPVARNDPGAGAVKAGAGAKRDVHVQRQGTRKRILVAGGQTTLVARYIKGFGKLRGRGIGRIAWAV